MIPKIGNSYHFFDDGKISSTRHYIAKCLDIIPFERFNDIIFNDALIYDHEMGECYISKNSTLMELWRLNVKDCPFLYAQQTDYAIQMSCPEYDEKDLYFVRTVDKRWFSINIQNDWQSGLLDITSEQFNSITNNKTMVDISKLLYKVPSGTTIYSPIWGDGTLYRVDNGIINVRFKGENNHKHFDRYGRMGENGECVIFPSKECRDWYQFEVPIKEGDIVAMDGVFNGKPKTWLCVFNGVKSDEQIHYYIGMTLKGEILVDSFYDIDKDTIIRYASEENIEKV